MPTCQTDRFYLPILAIRSMSNPKYRKSGDVSQSVGSIVGLIVGVGVAAIMLIVVSVLGGQVYQQSAADITAITDQNIENNITLAIQNSFRALATTGNYLPLIVLAVIIFIIMGLIMGLMSPRGGMGGYGYQSAL